MTSDHWESTHFAIMLFPKFDFRALMHIVTSCQEVCSYQIKESRKEEEGSKELLLQSDGVTIQKVKQPVI